MVVIHGYLTVPGIPDYRNGPFNSQYETSYQDPDVVYSISRSGVGKVMTGVQLGQILKLQELTGKTYYNIMTSKYLELIQGLCGLVDLWVILLIYMYHQIGVRLIIQLMILAMNMGGNISGIYTHPMRIQLHIILFSFMDSQRSLRQMI